MAPRALQAPRRFRRGDAAVASITGEVLLVGIVLVMAATIGYIILSSQDPPPDVPTAEFRARLLCGGSAWGDGDERFRLDHVSGEGLDAQATRIVLDIDGAQTTYGPGTFTDDLADGDFTIGEAWQHTGNISATAVIQYQVFTSEGGVDQAVIWRELDSRQCGTPLSPAGSPLPGGAVAFEDLLCDGAYGGGDLLVSQAELEAGYTADDDAGDGLACLVIPASTGPLTLSGLDAEATQDIVIEVDVTTTTDPVHLCAAADLTLPGVTVTAATNGIRLAAGGTVNLAGSELDSAAKITIGTGIDCAFLDAVTGIPQQLLAAGSTLDADADHLSMAAYDLIDVTGAVLHGGDQTASEAPSGMSGSWTVAVQAQDGAVEADGVDVGTATSNAARDVAFHALDGELSLAGAVLHSSGDGSTIDLHADGGEVDVQGADIRIDSGGDITIDVDGLLLLARVQDAEFRDANNAADMTPTGAFLGLPAFGTLE